MGHILGYVEIITSHCVWIPKIYPASPKDYSILLLRLLTWQIVRGFLADEIRIPWNPHGKDHADLESKLQSIQLARQS